jgi:7-carboxy-7-deazaguanine synthase
MQGAATDMTKTATNNASIVEIFSGIQGEGLLVGCRQIFVRFAECNLRCRYCDTKESWHAPETCRVEQTPGRRDFHQAANPLRLDRFSEFIADLAKPHLHHSVALTGGEPLLQCDFLGEFLPALKAMGLRTFLETNGSLPAALERVIDAVDIVAMDIKLPSATGENPHFDSNRHFLRVATRKSAFVKVIVAEGSTDEELHTVGDIVAEVDPTVTVVLQPVTPEDSAIAPPSPDRLLAMQEMMSRWARDVRVIPQTHKMIDQK